MVKSLLFIYALALVFLSLNPWLRPSSELIMNVISWDKVCHGLAYGILAIMILLAFRKPEQRFSLTIWAVLVSASAGVLIELLQFWLTAVRNFSWFDAYANSLGAVMGAFGFWAFRSLSGVGKQPRKKRLFALD